MMMPGQMKLPNRRIVLVAMQDADVNLLFINSLGKDRHAVK